MKLFIKRKCLRLLSIKYLLLTLGLAIMILTAYYQIKVDTLEENVKSLEYRLAETERIYDDVELTLKQETEKKEIDFKLLNNKVTTLHKFLSRKFPGYNYKDKIEEAKYDIDKLDDLPEDLHAIYVENYKMRNHGLEKYKLRIPNTIYPIDVDKGYVTYKNYEFGLKHPYEGLHTGTDINNRESSVVYAVADGEIFRSFYDKWNGNTIELKFSIEIDGEKQWYFVRYVHIDSIQVSKGDRVKQGDIIAGISDTGLATHGSHLHFAGWEWNGTRWVNINLFLNSTYGNRWKDKI